MIIMSTEQQYDFAPPRDLNILNENKTVIDNDNIVMVDNLSVDADGGYAVNRSKTTLHPRSCAPLYTRSRDWSAPSNRRNVLDNF